MDFDLPPGTESVRQRVRAFVREEVLPLEPAEVGEEGLPADLLAGVRAKARAAGVWAPQLPREHGGLGLDTAGLCVVFEEAGYSPLGPLALHCAVSDEQVLGRPGEGFKLMQQRLGPARLTHCMRWLGAAARAVDIACDYARKRQAFGKALAEHQGVQWPLADSAIEMHAFRLM